MRGSLIAVLALLLPALSVGASAPAEAPWWETTVLDADRDGLDDALLPVLSGADPTIVLVAYAEVPSEAQRQAVLDHGHEIVNAYRHFPLLAVRTLPANVPGLRDLPGVVFVEANDVLVPLLKESVPLIGAPQVWKTYGARGRGITIAVLDDGAYEQHPDFQGKVAASYNAGVAARPLGPAGEAARLVTPQGDDGHGTHVAGTIVGSGGESNGVYKGVAPDARFVNVQVFAGPGQTNSDIVLVGLEWVIDNAERLDVRIVSMSLGGRASDGKDAISRGVNVAVDKGMIVVAAAGNTGPGPKTITAPGAAEKAITVGAVDKSKRPASFSSRGPTLDGRTKPDLAAPGSGITSTIPPVSSTTTSNLLSGNRQIYYGALSGTSMAAPHVSGVVALMLEENPDLTAIEVKRILLATAQDLGDPGHDNVTGYGFVNAIAAVQVARDPALLQSARFQDILATIPEPEDLGFLDRMEYEIESARRDGTLLVYGGLGISLVAIAIIAGVLVARRRR